jgi:uncharacterized protein DUF3592
MERIEADLLVPGKGEPIRDGVVVLDGPTIAYANRTASTPDCPPAEWSLCASGPRPTLAPAHTGGVKDGASGRTTHNVRTQSPCQGARLSRDGTRLGGVLEVGFAELARQGPDSCRLWRHARRVHADPGVTHSSAAPERCNGPGHRGGRETTHSEDSITYAPVVRFTTADGRTVEFTSSVGYSSKPDVGGAVDVRYLPDDPEQAEIDRATMWMLPAAFGLLGGLGLLVAGVVVYSDEPQAAPAMVDSVDGTGQVEPAREPLPSSRPAVATGRIGDRLAVYDEVGNVQLVVTVTRLKFSTGDEFDQPLHGFFMGAYVEAHALADDQYIFNFHALVGGQLYVAGAITGSTAFDPSPEPGPLHAGERRVGWLVFDVPARHGQLVMRDLDDHNVGVWKY